ncbi:MAG: peptide-binding protein [Planctomycetales bacterium]|nr:peptide-binding protein [Planctomycetales bacterium]
MLSAILGGCGGGDAGTTASPGGPPAGGATGGGGGSSEAPRGPLIAGVGYDPRNDPLVNPLTLQQVHDRAQATESEWFYANLDGNPSSLNPIFFSSTYDNRAQGMMYDGLFTFDAKMTWKLNTSVVESFEESPDHKVWTVRMRPGLKWHDGHPFTAHDVAFSFQQIMDERVPCPAVRDGTDQLETVEALDDRTVRMVHKEPLPTAKWNALYPIIPKHIFEQGKAEDPTLKTSAYYARVNREPVGNGPYKFVEWKDNDKIVFERWDAYHGTPGHFKRVVFRIIPDDNVSLMTLEKGEVDEVELTSPQFADATVKSEEFKKRCIKAMAPQWSLSYFGWNIDGSNPFFSDPRVRRAMTHACNIPGMIAKIAYNLPQQSAGMFHPDSWMFPKGLKPLPYDLALAGRLLDEAGWHLSDEDGWRYKDGRRFSFTVVLSQGNTTALEICAVFQQDLKSLGVEMQTQVMEFATLQEKWRKHEFQAMMAGWGTGTDPDTTWNIWHSESYTKGRNYVGFKDPEVDALYERGRREFDQEKRGAIYQEIHRRIYEKQPYTFLWHRPILWGFNRRIRGVEFSPRGVWGFDPSIFAWWVSKSEQLYNLK